MTMTKHQTAIRRARQDLGIALHMGTSITSERMGTILAALDQYVDAKIAAALADGEQPLAAKLDTQEGK